MWLSDSAICGRSRDLKRKGRPIFYRDAPRCGIHSNGAWLAPVMKMWDAIPPAIQGHRALFFHSDAKWNVDTARFASYYAALRLLRPLSTSQGLDSKWALHSARNWLPTCAIRLGWSEEDRRTLGRWASNSEMMGRYDRALCATELRLRNGILSKITGENWFATASLEVPNDSQSTPPSKPDVTLRPKTKGPEPESDVETSTGAAFIDNVEGLEEVDIADLFGGGRICITLTHMPSLFLFNIPTPLVGVRALAALLRAN